MHSIRKHIIKHHKKYLAWWVWFLMAHFFIAKVFLAKIFVIKIIVIISAIFGILLEHYSSAGVTPILRATYTAFDLATKEDDHIIMPMLDDMINRSNLNLNNLIQIKNILPIYEGNDYVKEITQKIITLSEIQVNTTIKNLIEKNVLTVQDLANLNNNISIKYLLGCDKTRGSYTIQQSENIIGDIRDTTLENITLNVNICFDYSYIQDLPKYVQQITAHELGHYVYYFKDTNPQSFEQKCRNGKKTICPKKDFISKYAQTWPEEDYAESFAYRYLWDTSNPNLIKKFNHFSTLF